MHDCFFFVGEVFSFRAPYLLDNGVKNEKHDIFFPFSLTGGHVSQSPAVYHHTFLLHTFLEITAPLNTLLAHGE